MSFKTVGGELKIKKKTHFPVVYAAIKPVLLMRLVSAKCVFTWVASFSVYQDPLLAILILSPVGWASCLILQETSQIILSGAC